MLTCCFGVGCECCTYYEWSTETVDHSYWVEYSWWAKHSFRVFCGCANARSGVLLSSWRECAHGGGFIPPPLPEKIALKCCVVALGAHAEKNSKFLEPYSLNLNDILMYSTRVDLLACIFAQPVHGTTTTLPWAMKIEAVSIFLMGQKQRRTIELSLWVLNHLSIRIYHQRGAHSSDSPDTEWLSRIFLWRPVIFRRHFSEKAC